MDLYIYAYPAQMITFQGMKDNKVVINENCTFADVIRTTHKFLDNTTPIYNIYIVGDTFFADKIEAMVRNAFNHKVNIERVDNA